MSNVYHELAQFIGQFEFDPLGFVRSCFPWGEENTALAGFTGPDEWQTAYLKKLGEDLRANDGKENQVIRKAISSGHGIGKSATVAWLILWAISTKVNAKGVVTSNTETQLRTKCWAELQYWANLFVGKPLFVCTATAIYSADEAYEKTWRIDAVSWSVSNTEAFAGLHARGRRVVLIFDEASAIDPAIWEVAEGALTDKATQILWAAFGNPTRASGRFYDCFHALSSFWDTQKIDSRHVSITNKEQLQSWVDMYGEDSDFVRVRVRGEFPRQGSTQFFSSEAIASAIRSGRQMTSREYASLPPVFGVDVARFGDDSSVITVKQGDYIHKPMEFKHLDIMALSTQVFDTYRSFGSRGIICVDGIGVGAGLVDILRARQLAVVDIQSAASAVDAKTYSNKRAELYGRLRDYLNRGGTLPDDRELADQLKDINYGFTNKLTIQLESKADIKKRRGESPDKADSVAYLFAAEELRELSIQTSARKVRPVSWM